MSDPIPAPPILGTITTIGTTGVAHVTGALSQLDSSSLDPLISRTAGVLAIILALGTIFTWIMRLGAWIFRGRTQQEPE